MLQIAVVLLGDAEANLAAQLGSPLSPDFTERYSQALAQDPQYPPYAAPPLPPPRQRRFTKTPVPPHEARSATWQAGSLAFLEVQPKPKAPRPEAQSSDLAVQGQDSSQEDWQKAYEESKAQQEAEETLGLRV